MFHSPAGRATTLLTWTAAPRHRVALGIVVAVVLAGASANVAGLAILGLGAARLACTAT